MVPACEARSSTPIVSSSSATVSPRRGLSSGRSVTSTASRSIDTRPARGPSRAVTDRIAHLDVALLYDAAIEPHRGAHEVEMPRRRVGAIKGDTGPHQIVMGVGPEENARRIGERAGDARKEIAQLSEIRHLPGVERMARFLRTGEVAHQQIEAGAAGERAGVELRDVLGAQPEAIHPGVDVECRGAMPALQAERVPFGKLL